LVPKKGLAVLIDESRRLSSCEFAFLGQLGMVDFLDARCLRILSCRSLFA